MQYRISRISPTSQFIQIKLLLDCQADETIRLQLPAWRPGRYELANFAQKIHGFHVEFGTVQIIWKKITKDLWQFKAKKAGCYAVQYAFYANQMDAGACWSDDRQLYLNFTNCAFEIKGREQENIQLSFDLPHNYKIATALPQAGAFQYAAENFQHLIDSPVLASADLKHYDYRINHKVIHLWFLGEIHFDVGELTATFRRFTEKQIMAFGEFPAQEYHFIFQLLPYDHYHGVEHQYSTVITIGPAESLREKSNLDKLIGVSSHEFYHFWNVCRIRPKALTPYDLSKEAYLDTGLVLEGVTTYMGDMYLLRSAHYCLSDYLGILQKQLKREFESLGWKNQSVADSSFDLWLDGYKTGIPEKKVSIYNRGALICLCLDLLLLNEGSSLQQVMKLMWKRFGKTGLGYQLADFESILNTQFKDNKKIKAFFKEFVIGKSDLFPVLQECLQSIGLEIRLNFDMDFLAHQFGIITDQNGIISRIHPQSQAYHQLMIADAITAVDNAPLDKTKIGNKNSIDVRLKRWGRELEFTLEKEKDNFYPDYTILSLDSNTKRENWMS